MAETYNPTTIYNLIGIAVSLGLTTGVDKQLNRFQIANGHNDPQLTQKLGGADPALVSFLADRLANAIYNVA